MKKVFGVSYILGQVSLHPLMGFTTNELTNVGFPLSQ